MTNLTWRKKAACRGLDPEIFYPVSEEDAAPAKSVCSECAVRTPCLEYALTNREHDGIGGGATEKERRRIVRQRRKSA
jgi:WhiB family redox-sensing transcriptional regulator